MTFHNQGYSMASSGIFFYICAQTAAHRIWALRQTEKATASIFSILFLTQINRFATEDLEY